MTASPIIKKGEAAVPHKGRLLPLWVFEIPNSVLLGH
jgi:hypothetical protein